jgi:hypothetical protein
MALRDKYTAGLVAMGFTKIDSRCTKWDVYQGDTIKLYGVNAVRGTNDRFMFVSRKGPSLRFNVTGKATDGTYAVIDKVKEMIIKSSGM